MRPAIAAVSFQGLSMTVAFHVENETCRKFEEERGGWWGSGKKDREC